MMAIVTLLILALPQLSVALPCDAWLKHLGSAHNVYVIKNSGVRNSSFNYTEIPNTPYMVAIRRDQEKDWVLDVKSIGSNGAFVVRNTVFGYSGEFDGKGNCKNSTEFGYQGKSGMKNSEEANFRDSLSNKKVKLLYDWSICERVKPILLKHKMWQTEFDDDRLKSISVKDHDLLEKLHKESVSSRLYQVEMPMGNGVPTLVNNCESKERHLEVQGKLYPSTLEKIYQRDAAK